MAKYRVFVTRHYIDVCFFDVETDSPRKARTLAKRAAYKLREDSRAVATDNGWHADEPVEIRELGNSAAPFTVKPFLKTKQGVAFIDASEHV